MAKKKYLVFLPGMMCDHRLFNDVSHYGYFKSFTHKHIAYKGNSIAEMATNALSEITATQFSAIGLSMGGIVLMEMLKKAQQRVNFAVLANTNCHAELPQRQSLRAEEVAEVIKNGLNNFVVEEMKPKYFSPQLSSGRKQEVQKLVLDMANKLGIAAFATQSIALRDRADYETTLQQITSTKVLYVYGEDDMLCPAVKHRHMHSITAGSFLTAIENAGHLSALENPAAFYAAVQNFLQRAGE